MSNTLNANVKITIDLDSPAVQENALYLYTTALEGGINYWAIVHSYKWSDGNGNPDFTNANAIISEEMSPSRKKNLDPTKMIKGLIKLVEAEPGRMTQCGGSYASLLMSLSTSDCDDYDAIDASIIAQFALNLVDEDQRGRLTEIYG